MKRLFPARLLAALRSDASARLELPGDLVHASRRRVSVAAALGVAAYAAFLIFESSGLTGGGFLEHAIDLAHDVAGLLLCGALLLLTIPRGVDDRVVLRAALAVEVLLCAVISVAVTWAGWERTRFVPGLTWVVPVMILFPLLVPSRPLVSLAVSLLCALTMPAALVVLDHLHRVHARPADVLTSAVTGLIAAGIAAVGARTVYGAGQKVAAARAAGSYELLEPLGRGGMGEVWKARHAFLARPAAVKVILPDRLQASSERREQMIQRFTREARVTASLRSPHTVELFDFGAGEGGTLYYAMELLDGMNTEHFVYRFGPIAPRRAVAWLGQACHSLGEAHARGLVHRDIKPANLFVCRFGRDCDWVKVLDFGLTKPLEADPSVDLTGAGVRVGTPAYMAPEQVFGVADARSDLYALGCVGYFLLCGERPFDGETAGDLLRQHVEVAPPAPSTRCGKEIPAALEAVILRCLAKDPAGRPADADGLRAELEESLEGERWTEEEARTWWDAHLGTR